jgi:hypothetical protein
MQTNTITQWSFSRWNTYTTCPFRAKCKFILKLPEPQSEAGARGDDVGKAAEAWLAGAQDTMPVEAKGLQQPMEELRKLPLLVQQEWAFTVGWQPTGWFDKDCWLRIKTDVVAKASETRAEVVDGKTGKVRDEHKIQLDLYAVGAFCKYENIDEVRVRLFYYDQNTIAPENGKLYERSDLPMLKRQWLNRVAPMLRDDKFVPTPGNHCKWCAYRKSKGGPCEFG